MMVACASQKSQSTNQNPSGRQGGPPSFSQLLSQMDANEDGKLSQSEVSGPLQRDFLKMDSNADGFITESELENAPRPQRGPHPPKN
ncbi:MAG: EF-hand domain-containing protein [Saprospiraceae bacterium]|nr:EF-hand domain-containing protein [Saprospiraceae bacterium]